MFRASATFGLINRTLRTLNHVNRPVCCGASFSSAARTLKLLQTEYDVVRTLLRRRGLSNTQIDLSLERILSCSIRQYSTQNSPPPQQPSGGGGPERRDGKKNDKDEDGDKNNENITSLMAKAFLLVLTAYMILLGLTLLLGNSNQSEQIFRYVSWNEFVHQMLAKGEVEELIVRPDLDMVTIILYEGAVIKGRKVDFNTYHMNIADSVKFEEKLRAAEAALGIPSGRGVQVVYERGGDTAGKLLASIIFAFILLSILSRGRAMRSPLSMDRVSQLGRAKFTLIDPHRGEGRGVKFADVAGLKEVKMEVMEIVDYLKKPERYKLLGAKVPKGVLLLGPPGCGKTLLAKAIATEAEIPFLSMNGSEFIEMIGGLGAARVRDLFKEGRKRTPCIIYIDEIDAMGRKRSGSEFGGTGGATGESEQTLNQLLVEMDGIASKEGVLLLASTNRADVLDKALLRPGRFDRHILIDLPTVQEREEIFVHHLKSVKVDGNINEYAKRLAYLTPGFSGADIANVVNESALHAARYLKEKVDKKDLEYAIERVVGGTEKQSHAMTPAEKKTVSVHEAGHALVGWLTPEADVLLKVTIVPRTNLALGFAQYTPSDQKLYTKEELLARMRMALGGRAAEAAVFNRVTTGAQNDLKKVTDMAYSMVRSHGMSKSIGPLSFAASGDGRRPYSKKLTAAIDMEASRIVALAYQDVEKILAENRDKLDKLSTALFEKETLEYADVEKLLGPPVGQNRRFVHPEDFELSLKQAKEEGNQPETPPPAPKESEEVERTTPCTPVATI